MELTVRGEMGYVGKTGKTGIRVRVRNVTEITQGPLQRKWDNGGIKAGPWEAGIEE